MSYNFFNQVIPPTGVELCLSARFTSEDDINLIVAKTNVLEVYALHRHEDSKDGVISLRGEEPKDAPPYAGTQHSMRLVLSSSLFGNIESMAAVRFPGTSKDALLLSFRDAKISVLEFDIATNDLRTISLHYFEDYKVKEGHDHYIHVPELRVDPQQRCAAMLAFDRKLVVLPFRQHASLMEIENGGQEDQPVKPSFLLDLRAMGIINVKDFVFLQGYYEPTLLILYEPTQTWSGRVAVNRNTCVAAAVSLNLWQHRGQTSAHPVVWSAEFLPYDTQRLIAVPGPIGGALALSTNSLLYLNQASASCLPLNVFADLYLSPQTPFPSAGKNRVGIALDAARDVFLADDQLLVSLKGGELYIFHLLSDGRTVNDIQLTKAGSSVITSCMATLSGEGADERFLFLGSRVGDSLLLQYTTADASAPKQNGATKGSLFDDIKKEEDNDDDDEDEEEEASGEGEVKEEPDGEGEVDEFGRRIREEDRRKKKGLLTTYKFKVCDSLVNVGPITDFAIGESFDPASVSMAEQEGQRSVEIVTCSGQGKNGSLCVLQHGVRPELVHASADLAGCKAFWTLYHRSEERQGEEAEYHAYLLLSEEEQTRVIAGDGLDELSNEETDFNVAAPTVDAGNLFEQTRIVQVHQHGLILLDGVKATQRISTPGQIAAASIADPYVLVLMADGALRLYFADPTSSKLVQTSLQNIHEVRDIMAMHLFYGGAMRGKKARTNDEIFAAIAKDNGRLDIYSVPEFDLVFSAERAANGPRLINNVLMRPPPQSAAAQQSADTTSARIAEIALHSIGNIPSLPHLFLYLDNGELLLYRGFLTSSSPGAEGELEVAFKRCDYDPLPRSSLVDPVVAQALKRKREQMDTDDGDSPAEVADKGKEKSDDQRADHAHQKRVKTERSGDDELQLELNATPAGDEDGETEKETSTLRYRRIHYFGTVGKSNGVFISGSAPAWVFAQRGYARLYPMKLDTFVRAFAEFHNANCPHGFIYFNHEGTLKICQLPAAEGAIHWELPGVVRKVPLGRTPREIAYHPPSRTYVVALATPVTTVVPTPPETDMERQEREREEEESREMGIEPEEKQRDMGPREIAMMEERHELHLISPRTWQILHHVELEPKEHVLTLSVLKLGDNYSQVNRELRPYVVVGTSYAEGEDAAGRGRLLIYEIDVTGEEQCKLTMAYQKPMKEKPMKGPVSAAASLQGYLIIAVGPKIWVFNFDGGSTEAVAFYDAPHYIVSIKTLKNFVLCGDIYKSIFFLRWKDSASQLALLAKDVGRVSVFATEYVVDKQNLALLMSDERQNLQVTAYAPHTAESRGGQLLVPRGDFNVGQSINKFVRLPMTLPSGTTSLQRHALWFGTLSGGVGYLAPMDESVFRRLGMLQSALLSAIPHTAGLHPQAYRALQRERLLRNRKHTILDGLLLSRYLALDSATQQQIALKLGTSRERILNDLQGIPQSVTHTL